jgi:cell division protein ZapA
MSNEIIETVVEILGRTYHVKCTRAQISVLQNAAKNLENRLQSAREVNNTLDSDRIVMVTALNLMHELLSVTQQHENYSQWVNQKLNILQNKIDSALICSSQVELGTAEKI